MKTKHRKSKRTKKPTTPRDSLQQKIAAAETNAERIRLAVFGESSLPDDLAAMVKQWRWVRMYRSMKKTASKEDRAMHAAFAEGAERDLKQFAVACMVHHQPEMFVELAKEMKRQESFEHVPAIEDFVLLKQSESGPVNIKQTARVIAEYQKSKGQYRSADLDDRAVSVEKTLRRKAKVYRIKTADRGRPRK